VRFLYVIPGEPEGWLMIFSRREAAAIGALGVEGRVFFLRSRTSIRALWREWRRLRRELGEFRPDLVHAGFGTVTALFVALGTARPLVVTFGGNDLLPNPDVGRLRSGLGRLCSQLAAFRARRIICVSAELRERLWWRQDRAEVIPQGVDLDLFRPRERDAARRELGWGLGERVVLFNAGLQPRRKRLDLAEEAVARARPRLGALRLVVTRCDVPPERMPLLMSAADCLLVTSESEGSPNVVKEALACDLPVVSVDVGDVRERLDGVHPSHLVARDPAALAGALCDLLARPRRSNGREHARPLSLRLVAERVLHVYREAAPEPSPLRRNLRCQSSKPSSAMMRRR
jgi:glycosyltransferase involved in cell wall biosynthesis